MVLFFLLTGSVYSQEMEPRRWAHLPINSNIFSLAVVHTNIDISLDPVLKIEDGKVGAKTLVSSYLHSFKLLGKTARLDFRLPYQKIYWQGSLNGQFNKVQREGLDDPLIRLSINSLGAPALKNKEYLNYRSTHKTNTVVGAALGIVVPIGQYKKNKLLNIGENRFVIRPQLGFVHSQGAWSYELTGTVNFFTDNNEFWGSGKLKQKPLSALQTHIVHSFKNKLWGSVSFGYDWGGQTTVNGITKDNKKENLFFAISSGVPISRTSSIKLSYVGSRTQKNQGNDSDSFVLAFSLKM